MYNISEYEKYNDYLNHGRAFCLNIYKDDAKMIFERYFVVRLGTRLQVKTLEAPAQSRIIEPSQNVKLFLLS